MTGMFYNKYFLSNNICNEINNLKDSEAILYDSIDSSVFEGADVSLIETGIPTDKMHPNQIWTCLIFASRHL